MTRIAWSATALVTVCAAAALSAQPARQLARAIVDPKAATNLEVTSPAFQAGQKIPDAYGADGDNFSPALAWRNPPSGTRSFVVMVEDPDAATPKPFVHWTLYNLPAEVMQLHENIPGLPQLPALKKARQGRNSRGTIGYVGPRPPQGDPPHHYHFQVFALDTVLNLPPGADAQAIIDAINGHVLASGEIVGLFQR